MVGYLVKATNLVLQNSGKIAMQILHAWSKLAMEDDIMVYNDVCKQEWLVVPGSIKHVALENFHSQLGYVGIQKLQSSSKRIWVAFLSERHTRFSSYMFRLWRVWDNVSA